MFLSQVSTGLKVFEGSTPSVAGESGLSCGEVIAKSSTLLEAGGFRPASGSCISSLGVKSIVLVLGQYAAILCQWSEVGLQGLWPNKTVALCRHSSLGCLQRIGASIEENKRLSQRSWNPPA